MKENSFIQNCKNSSPTNYIKSKITVKFTKRDYKFYCDLTKILTQRAKDLVKTSIKKLNRFKIFFDFLDENEHILYCSFNLDFVFQNYSEDIINLFCELHNFIAPFMLKGLEKNFGNIVFDTTKDDIDRFYSLFI